MNIKKITTYLSLQIRLNHQSLLKYQEINQKWKRKSQVNYMMRWNIICRLLVADFSGFIMVSLCCAFFFLITNSYTFFFAWVFPVGVAVCFKKYAPQLLLQKISGASAGCLAATCLLTGMPLGKSKVLSNQQLLESLDHTLRLIFMLP